MQWQKDDFGLGFKGDSRNPRYVYSDFVTNMDLTITGVRLEDAGYYKCLVYTSHNLTIASSVKVEVMIGVTKPEILQNNPLVLLEGDEVSNT